VYEFCRGYAARPSVGKRLVIYGNNGAGKSHTAKAIHRWAGAVAMNLPLVNSEENDSMSLATSAFVNWGRTVDRLKAGEWELIDNLLPANLLVIDDLGAEHDPSKVGMSKLYQILERREWKWTVITTNTTPDRWEEKFERRVASRLLRNTVLIDVSEVPDFNSN
jgi:DNA replication protein DnaC